MTTGVPGRRGPILPPGHDAGMRSRWTTVDARADTRRPSEVARPRWTPARGRSSSAGGHSARPWPRHPAPGPGGRCGAPTGSTAPRGTGSRSVGPVQWDRPTGAPDVTRPSVASAMLHRPKVWGSGVSVGTLREAFEDDHVHAVLLVDGPVLVAVVGREDISSAPDVDVAWRHGRLRGRTVGPHDDLSSVHRWMLDHRRRRLAVVDQEGTLLGLLCLTRSGRGFCRDEDIAAREAERLAEATAPAADVRAADVPDRQRSMRSLPA